MPIHIRDPMEWDPQWIDVRTKKPVRKKKDLPPEILKIAGVINMTLRHCVYTGGPEKLVAAPPAWHLVTAIAVIRAQQVIAGDKGKANVNKRHAAPGGSRDLADEVRKAWASGKYKSREKCADDVYEHIGVSRKAARNALIGTPKPIR
ncbi:MAG TPA: hypothetical protein VJ833_10220 [Rhodanobacteraceae bacterium]|nr:hypothetical protein [Rhodanobacteraceae bacterium]